MPVHRGKDSKGKFYQWGNHGKKYYYTKNGTTAKRKAAKQGRAIKANHPPSKAGG